MNYLFHVLILISLYAALSLSLNLVVGYAGLLSLCHAAFYGIGAYTATILMVNGGWSFFPAMLAAICVTGVLSLVVGVPSLRLRGDYFVLATLGFQIIVFSVLYNWVGFTKGPYGITAIPSPRLLGIVVDTPFRYFVLSSVICATCGLLIYRLASSPFGRVLRAVREDEIAAAALGKNVAVHKQLAFALSAAIAAVPGALFAGYGRYIDPTSFTLNESIFVLALVVIGGAGNIAGPVIGTTVVVVLPEAIRFLGLPDAVAANLRQVIYGLALILLMLLRPQGIRGEYAFD